MSPKLFNLAGLAAITAIAACSQPEPQRPVISPIYDKVGNVVGCVGSDGQDYPVPTPGTADVYDDGGQGRNPCDPICTDPQYSEATGQYRCRPPGECENGFYNQAGQWICRDDDGGDDDEPWLPDPQDPEVPSTGGQID